MGRDPEVERLLDEFFPAPRETPSYGIEIKLEATDPATDETVCFALMVDELPEPPRDEVVAFLLASCEAQVAEIAPGRVIVRRVSNILRNLTDAERAWPN